MILVTGAAGKTGQALIQALSSAGAEVRALIKHKQYRELVLSLGAKDYFVADMGDSDRMIAAYKSVKSVYHISPNMSPNEFQYGEIAIRAAKRAGVQHFVFHSVLHPQTQGMPHHWQKLLVEELLFESGLPFTILQPAVYMQNILAYQDAIVSEHRYPVPYSIHARTNLVDLQNIAEVGAKVLTESDHYNAVYELAGLQSFSAMDITKILSSQLETTVEAVELTRTEWERSARNRGLGEYQIQTLGAMFDYYQQFGFEGNPNLLTHLLGRDPTSLASFIRFHFSAETGNSYLQPY